MSVVRGRAGQHDAHAAADRGPSQGLQREISCPTVEEQAQCGAAHAPLGSRATLRTRHRQRQQGHREVDDRLVRGAQGDGRPDGEEAPSAAPHAERLDDDIVVGRTHDSRCQQTSRPKPRDLAGQVLHARRGRRRARVLYGARRVEHEHEPTDVTGQARRDRRDAPVVTRQRSANQVTLRGETTSGLVVLLRREQTRDRLGHGDERRLLGHLDQRQPRLGRGSDQRCGHGRVGQPDADTEPDDTCIHESTNVRRARSLLLGQAHPRGEQQLAALEERRRVLELAHGHPAHRAVEVISRGQHGEPEICPRGDVTQRWRHSAPCLRPNRPVVRSGQG